jgi:hypothetical protein
LRIYCVGTVEILICMLTDLDASARRMVAPVVRLAAA